MLKYIIVILLWMPLSLAAQGVFTAETKLDTNAMLIGDHVGMSMKFSMPSNAKVHWPVFDTILHNIQVIGRAKIDTTLSADKKNMTLSQLLVITSYDSGFYTIPPVRFYYVVPPDTTLRFEDAGTLLLAVHAPKVDTTQAIKPIKGVMRVPVSFREILPWILAGLVAIALVLLVIWYIRKRKKAEPLIRLKPRIHLQPHEIALSELEKLRTRKLWQNGKIKEYHTELTDILRKYIEGRFSISALESTSSEILSDLRAGSHVEGIEMDRLKGILFTADLVKFAKSHPLPDENEGCLENAIEFVKDTIVRNEPVTPENIVS